jgi:hypothetical protein
LTLISRFPLHRLAAAILIGAAGCGGGSASPGGGAPVTRDSAGVQIVENAAPKWADGAGWTIADSATLDIGGGGNPETELSQVVAAVRLADGRVAVAPAVGNAIRIFDPTGKLAQTIGRAGAGPGEFQSITGLWRGPGDSLLVSDMMLQRLTVLDPAAGFVRSFSLGGQSGFAPSQRGQVGMAFPQGRLADGTVIGMRMAFGINDQREGNVRDTIALIRYGADGAAKDTLAKFPGIEMTQMAMTFGNQTVNAPTPVPLGRNTIFGVAADRFFVATNERWEVEARNPDGSLQRLIRVASEPTPVTEAAIAAHRLEQIEQMEGAPQFRSIPEQFKKQFVDRINTAKYPPTMPWIAGLFPVSDGSLWVEEQIVPGNEQRRYAVFDPSGALLGRVTAPSRLRVVSVYQDVVVGVWRDPDDVEHVRIHPIKR